MMKRTFAAVFQLAVFCAGCSAQALSVSPVNIIFPAGQRAGKMTITNRGDRETVLQVRVYRWDQNGESSDDLLASDAVLVSPPITSIAPGATQLVRLVLRDTPATREGTYRVILDEVPPPPKDGVVAILLRVSIPVFVQPLNHARSHLRFHVDQKGNDLLLVVDNDGGTHEKLRDVELSAENGAVWKTPRGLLPYVLAGATRTWRLTPGPGASDVTKSLMLKAASEAGPVQQSLLVTMKP